MVERWNINAKLEYSSGSASIYFCVVLDQSLYFFLKFIFLQGDNHKK